MMFLLRVHRYDPVRTPDRTPPPPPQVARRDPREDLASYAGAIAQFVDSYRARQGIEQAPA
jgi:hypothetical protein